MFSSFVSTSTISLPYLPNSLRRIPSYSASSFKRGCSFFFPRLCLFLDFSRIGSFRLCGLDQTLRDESLSYLEEPGDVGASDVVAGHTVLFGRLPAGVVDVLHGLLESLVGELIAPRLAARALLHLQGRDGYATGANSLGGTEGDAVGFQEGVYGPRGARHVGPFAYRHATVLYKLLGVFFVELVLGSTR